MSKIRELFISQPLLVSSGKESEIPDPKWIESKRFARIYELVYDDEIVCHDPDGVFAEKKNESISDRLKLSEIHPVGPQHEQKNAYINQLKLLASLSYKINKGEGDWSHIEAFSQIKTALLKEEYKYPDVSSIITVDEASMVLTWVGVASLSLRD